MNCRDKKRYTNGGQLSRCKKIKSLNKEKSLSIPMSLRQIEKKVKGMNVMNVWKDQFAFIEKNKFFYLSEFRPKVQAVYSALNDFWCERT